MLDALSFVDGLTALENYEIVRRAAEQKGDSDVVAAEKSLKSLISARAKLMDTKAALQRAILERIADDNNTGANEIELNEYEDSAKKYGIASEGDAAAEAENVYLKQLQDIREGDLAQLMSDIDACERS